MSRTFETTDGMDFITLLWGNGKSPDGQSHGRNVLTTEIRPIRPFDEYCEARRIGLLDSLGYHRRQKLTDW